MDDYYSAFDTVGKITTIKFTAEFERLVDKIKKFWKLKATPKSETEKVSRIFAQMQTEGEAAECAESVHKNTLAGLSEYLRMMKDYYSTEVRIRNIY